MVRVIQSEWHQVEKRYGFDFDEDILSEIYPDLDEDDIATMLEGLKNGDVSIDQIIDDAWENNVEIEWDWLDEDDWWTDRKGGYEVTYEVDKESSDTNISKKAAWPFPAGTPVSEDDENETENDESVDQELLDMLTDLKNEYDKLSVTDSKELTIRLYGRGTDRGIGTITKAQYEYWTEHSDELGDALNDQYDYEENETPEEARLPYEYYNEYEDIAFETGIDEDSCYVQITDSEENELFDAELTEFLSQVHGEDDSYYEATEEIEEMYLMNTCMKPGYYLYWQQGGKGTYFESTISIPEDKEFDPKLLKFNTVDFQGNSMITEVLYDGESLDNLGGEWSGKWDQYEVCQVKE